MRELEAVSAKSFGWRPLSWLEHAIVCASLIAMTTLPLAEIALRRIAGVGIKGSTAMVQHLCLIVGLAGAAVAARNNRLLSLSTLGEMIKGRGKTAARVFACSVAFAVTALLCAGSLRFVIAERSSGQTLVYNIPIWWIQLVMPVGFALMALYILLNTGASWS